MNRDLKEAREWADEHLGRRPDNWADICNEELERDPWVLPDLCLRWILHDWYTSVWPQSLGQWGDEWHVILERAIFAQDRLRELYEARTGEAMEEVPQ